VQVRERAANQDQPTERQNTTLPACYTDCPPVIAHIFFIEELTKMLLESTLLRDEAEPYALTGLLAAVTFPPPCTIRSWPTWIGRRRCVR
jgi:hypothetical protein